MHGWETPVLVAYEETMTPEQLTKLERLLTEAADKHIAAGGKIIDKRFMGTESNEYCPITALLRAQKEHYNDSIDCLSVLLGVRLNYQQTYSIWYGFDDMQMKEISLDYDKDIYAIGQRLRAKYIKPALSKETIKEWVDNQPKDQDEPDGPLVAHSSQKPWWQRCWKWITG
jgi:hypothetical protein